MSNEKRNYRHSLTGVTALMTPDAASVFPQYLEEVDIDAKDVAPQLVKPDTLEGKGKTQSKSTGTEKTEEAAKAPAADDATDSTTNVTNLREGN